jgi:parvulin-like peptidyl-prolyl isomerase
MEAGMDIMPGEEGAQIIGVSVDKLAKAMAAIRKMELDEQRLDLDRQKLVQSGEALTLEKKKFQRVTAELFIKYAEDQKARDLATSDMPNDSKLEALGRHLFGEAW